LCFQYKKTDNLAPNIWHRFYALRNVPKERIMKLKWVISGSFLAGVLFTSCAENNNTNQDVGDTIETPLTDTVGVPTQGYGPDHSTIQVPDTMPEKDTLK
jgi:hypothetical protein